MTKILKPGTYPQEPEPLPIEGMCKGCGCVFEYQMKETDIYFKLSYISKPYYSIKCPQCSEIISLWKHTKNMTKK